MNELPEDISKLAEWILRRYRLSGVMIVATMDGPDGGSTHAEVGLSSKVGPNRRSEVLDTLSQSAIDLVAELDAAEVGVDQPEFLN